MDSKNKWARRGIVGGLAVLSSAATAGTAFAGSSMPITQTTTISGDPATSWASASTKAGEFGAGYTSTQSVTSDTSGANKSTTAENAVIIELFGTKVTLGDAWGKTMAGLSSTATQSYKVAIAGKTWINVANAALNASEVDFEKCTEGDMISIQFDVGPIPIIIEGGDEECTGVGLYGSSASGSSGWTLSGTVKPYDTNDLSVSAGVGTSEISAGITASVDLLSIGLPVTNTVNISSGNLNYSISGKLTLDTLDGDVSLYAKAFFITYKYKLFSWDGLSLANVVLFSDSVPVVSDVSATVYGTKATGSYAYSDAAGLDDKSTYQWSRSYSGSGSNPTVIGSSKDWNLVDADNTAYLQLCVTPYNGANHGTQQCSGWTHVMHTAQFYKNSNYGSTELVIAYQMANAGTCYNLTDYSFNDMLSSYKINGAANYATMVVFYKDIDCAGSTFTQTVSAGSVATQTDLSNVSGFNDQVTSFKVSWNDAISVSDVSVDITGPTASGVYSLDDDNNMSESGSVYTWSRASDASGTGAAPIATGTTSYTLTTSDSSKYLQFCITPSDGLATGTKVCSSWTYVGHLVEMWKDQSYSGTNLNIAYEKAPSGTCFNLPDYSFNDTLTSLQFQGISSGASTLWIFQDHYCSGSSATYTLSANGVEQSSNVGTTYGSGWNDAVSSFMVTY